MIKRIKMIINNKVVKAGSWYTVSNFFSKGIGFLTIPIFTRILTTADYGIVSVYTAWVSIFSVFIGFSLNESIRRAKYEYSEEFEEFVSSIIYLSIVIFLAFLFGFTLFIDELLMLTDLSKALFYFMVFQAFFSSIQNIMFTKYRLEYRYKLVSIINTLIIIMGVILSIVLITQIYYERKYIGKIIGSGILPIFLGVFFLLTVVFNRKNKNKFCWEYWKFGLTLGIPLIFHGLGIIANAQLDRVIINKYLGAEITGIYSFAYQISMIISVVFTSIDQAWTPWFFEKFQEKKHQLIRKRAIDMRNFFTIFYFTILMMSPEIIKIMATERYWDGLSIVPLIFMSQYLVFMYALEVNVEYSLKRTGLIAIGTVGSAVVNIGLNILFVPIYGYIAAAITTVISYFLLFLFHFFITSKILKHIEYGLKFHMQSISYLVGITIFYYAFEQNIIIRIIGIVIVWSALYINVLKRKGAEL